MMGVFKAIGNSEDVVGINEDDLNQASAVGYQRNNIYDYEWVVSTTYYKYNNFKASHIVQSKIKHSFETLIEQMCKRAEFIMKRLADIGSENCSLMSNYFKRV